MFDASGANGTEATLQDAVSRDCSNRGGANEALGSFEDVGGVTRSVAPAGRSRTELEAEAEEVSVKEFEEGGEVDMVEAELVRCQGGEVVDELEPNASYGDLLDVRREKANGVSADGVWSTMRNAFVVPPRCGRGVEKRERKHRDSRFTIATYHIRVRDLAAHFWKKKKNCES